MPSFNVTLAQTVRVYGHVRVEADTMADAVHHLHAYIYREDGAPDDLPAFNPVLTNPWDAVTAIEWGTATDETIVEIADHPARDRVYSDITLTFDDPETGVMVRSPDDIERILTENHIPGAARAT